MNRSKYLFITALLAFACFVCSRAVAEDAVVAADPKAEVKAAKETIKAQKQEMKESAQAARAEEKALKDQINQAVISGDREKAAQLREQLKSMHAQNVQEMREDKRELKSAKKELRQDMKKARKEGFNPPGPRGGPGRGPKK